MKFHEIVYHTDKHFFIGLEKNHLLTGHEDMLRRRYIYWTLGTCRPNEYLWIVSLFLEGKTLKEIMSITRLKESKVRKAVDIYLFKKGNILR